MQVLKYGLAVAVLCAVFLFGLDRAGLLGPDEPRYASIGREMARSGDWVTSRLWGDAWFEKPPLLYWMTAAGYRAGLGDDLSPRVPVALAAIAYLIFHFRASRRQFSERAAFFGTAILATAPGWLGVSQLGVTDLPLTITVSAALWLALPWISGGRLPLASGAFLGLAVLAKGLVPLVLIVPLLWMGRRRWRELLLPGAVALAIALPWNLLCLARNGKPFLLELYGKHHFSRFFSDELQHVRPWWWYLPIILALVFPWIPMVPMLFRKTLYKDAARLALLAFLLFGLLFFSMSRNKLPGYVMPLLPAFCALLGLALAEMRKARWPLVVSALMLGIVPWALKTLPAAVPDGLTRATLAPWSWAWFLPAVGVAAWCWWCESKGRRAWAVLPLVIAMLGVVVYIKAVVFPELDRTASARSIWREIAPRRNAICIEQMHRAWQYGLNHYSVEPLPDCKSTPKNERLVQSPASGWKIIGPQMKTDEHR